MSQQLFKTYPPIEFVEGVLKHFGIINFNESYKFSKDDIANKYVIQKMLNMPFENYYINCKYLTYFTEMDEGKCITVLRQLLKIYNYKVVSVEKFNAGKKHLMYHIEKIKIPQINTKTIQDDILEFD